MLDKEYSYLSRKIKETIGFDVASYKEQQMRRRLEGFISHAHAEGITSFCRRLESDQQLAQELRRFLTINVSEFFRDAEPFRLMKNHILPQLLSLRPSLKIWSAGCSNGSEPYSIAMLLVELSGSHDHRVLATDIDMASLAIAKAGGPYPSDAIRNIPRHLLLKYAVRSEDTYSVKDSIIKMVDYRHHDLLLEPFDTGFDLVLCRNVVIYFTEDAKDKLYSKFHHSLREDGVLFTGTSEMLSSQGNSGFARLYPSFYKKKIEAAALA